MQGFNKYHPPDYDPSKHSSLNAYHGKHALGDRARKLDKGILIVRFELPYNIWCDHCNNHIGQGVRYNAEKSKVGMYYTTPIWNFRCKCHLCQHWFEIRTDPANTRYVVHSGARQKHEEWDPAENGGVVLDEKSDVPPDPFASLEKTVTQKTRALSAAAALHALEEDRSNQWSDPYAASSLLRQNFRKAKKIRVASEGRAEGVREKYGLGERVTVEDLRTPAREVKDVEDLEWERARAEKERREKAESGKRRKEREQVGWKEERRRPSSASRPKSSSSSSRHLSSSSSSSSRSIKPLPSRSPAASSPALQSLSSRLLLASALKADPFLPASPITSSNSSAARAARAREMAGLVVGGSSSGKSKRGRE